VKTLGGLIGAMPADLRAEVIALDLGRVERAVSLVQAWWKRLAPIAAEACGSGVTAKMGACKVWVIPYGRPTAFESHSALTGRECG